MDSVAFAKSIESDLITLRRDIHRHPETGWLEYRTAAMVAGKLQRLGFEVIVGEQVLQPDERMGLPDAVTDQAAQKRALGEGAAADWVTAMAGGMTAVAGVMKFTDNGPVVAFRFDLDSNDVTESCAVTHEPATEGYSSMHEGAMHACGHDGHTTIGIGLARFLSQHKTQLQGTVKLIFQPAEEGCRGARAVAASGIVDDVDVLFGMHVGMKINNTGDFACACQGFMATSKLDTVYTGKASHAGASPEAGRNALLAACDATLNLYGIARHSGGRSGINVGTLTGGSGRNVIPSRADMKIETRGATTAINAYMEENARRILQAAAAMQDVSVTISAAGGAPALTNDADLAERIYHVAAALPVFKHVEKVHSAGGSEDCSWLFERVRAHGGRACYMGLGMDLKGPHHNPEFDLDEAVLTKGVAVTGALALDFLK